MRIGFSGTRNGMTDKQKFELQAILRTNKPEEFHHGDCVGADAQAHIIARSLGLRIHLHPPSRDNARAFCDSDVRYLARPYLDRNHDIVRDTEWLIIAPVQCSMIIRSGTWATYRYSLKIHSISPYILIP